MKTTPNKYSHLPFKVGTLVTHHQCKITPDKGDEDTFSQEVVGYLDCYPEAVWGWNYPRCQFRGSCKIRTLMIVNGIGFMDSHLWCMGHPDGISWRVHKPDDYSMSRYNIARKRYWKNKKWKKVDNHK